MKLVCGNGKEVEIRDVGHVIVKMTAKGNEVIPLYGMKIMSDDEARSFYSKYRSIANCKQRRSSNDQNNVDV